jgi:hypothetical protein
VLYLVAVTVRGVNGIVTNRLKIQYQLQRDVITVRICIVCYRQNIIQCNKLSYQDVSLTVPFKNVYYVLYIVYVFWKWFSLLILHNMDHDPAVLSPIKKHITHQPGRSFCPRAIPTDLQQTQNTVLTGIRTQ